MGSISVKNGSTFHAELFSTADNLLSPTCYTSASFIFHSHFLIMLVLRGKVRDYAHIRRNHRVLLAEYDRLGVDLGRIDLKTYFLEEACNLFYRR
jgi:hypothetical protein